LPASPTDTQSIKSTAWALNDDAVMTADDSKDILNFVNMRG
jgi:hypothetical protein